MLLTIVCVWVRACVSVWVRVADQIVADALREAEDADDAQQQVRCVRPPHSLHPQGLSRCYPQAEVKVAQAAALEAKVIREKAELEAELGELRASLDSVVAEAGQQADALQQELRAMRARWQAAEALADELRAERGVENATAPLL